MRSDAPDRRQRKWAMLCHASGLLVFLTGGIGGLLGPLLVWLLARGRGDYVDDQGRQAINFQITILIGVLAGGVLLVKAYGFGLLLLGLVYTWDLIMIVIAASRAWDGERYRYPWSLKLLPAQP